MAKSNNIVYLDFDGTLTGAHGKEVIGSKLCIDLSDKDTFEERRKFKDDYDQSEQKIKITEEARKFLEETNKLYPQVQIVIISRNYENYIKALLEFANIKHENITIYPRGMGNKLGPGEDKHDAVVSHEQKTESSGFRLICDDDEFDKDAMYLGLKDTQRNQSVSVHTEKSGEFKWGEYFKELLINCNIAVKEYLNGKTAPRTHLFTARVNDDIADQTFKDKYSHLKGDELKRAIINTFKKDIEHIDNVDDMKEFMKKYKESPEYGTLSKGQGLVTKLTGIQTSSQKAIEEIFNNKMNALNSPKPRL